MKEETTLSEVIEYIRSAKIGDLIFRRNLVVFGNGGSTVDNYRNYLAHAGYLKTRKPGMYEYMKEIPKDMTYNRLILEAYPDSQWVYAQLNEIDTLVLDGGVYDPNGSSDGIWHIPETILMFRGYDQETIDYLIQKSTAKLKKLFPEDF